jgi:hypothetical protein
MRTKDFYMKKRRTMAFKKERITSNIFSKITARMSSM